MKKLFTLFILFCTFSISFGQWSPSSAQGEKTRNGSDRDQYFTLDINQLKNQLSKAQTPGQYSKAVEISIPVLGSGIETFEIYSLPVVVSELAAKYQLGSYVGVAKNDKNKYIRFSLAPDDFQSMIIINGVSQFIEPLNKGKSLYRVFPKTVNTDKKSFICSTEDDDILKKQIKDFASTGNSFNKINASDFSKSSDKKYRTLRLAMSVTAEYTTYFGGVAQALTAINATLTRVNGIYEKDFGLHLNLQNYPALIYTNAATDPYSNAAAGSAGAWNNELQQTLTNVVGSANYDIGHLFGASGGGGNAGCIGCICIAPTGPTNNAKGSGYTSPGNGVPQGDTFDIDYVAHEMGHQFGGNHTFSMNLEGSGSNMEPGSGSTIMGYAGITGPTDVQSNSDAYFHARSIAQIQTNLINKTCDIETNVANNPPVFAALPDFTIPKSTAFVLSATATDPENDPMTFTWEQINNATQTTNGTNIGNLTNGPSFRSVLPTTTGNVRYFPRLSSVLAGVLNNSNNLWEAVPTVARTMQFAVTARDNNPAFNQQQTQNAVQNITVGNDGPFTITSTTGSNNAAVPITWNVVNTAAAPYNVANVKIDYTVNNGTTWVTLIASTPNDGSEPVTFTGLATGSTAKVRISAINNVFYTIRNINIIASTACNTNPPVGIAVSAIGQTTATVSWTSDPTATYILQYRIVGSPTWTTVNPATTPYNLVGLTGSSQYEVQIATICLAVTGAFSPSTNFTTPGVTYCVPTGGASSTTYYLNNITTTLGITNLTYTASSYSAYVNNSASTFTSIPGGIVNVSLGSAGGGTYYFYVWIDWNNDGDFLDAGETILATTTYTATGAAVINIPAAQAAGNYRVRFSTSFIGANTSCGPSAWGNYVDYTLVVGPPPTCLSPTNPVASAVVTTSATISWTASTSAPANGYQYFVSTTNVPPTATTIPTGTSATTSVNLIGLTLNTTYYFWVRAVCSATDSSFWAGGGSFTTTQIPGNLPYTQPFVGPNDFVFVNGTQTNKWAYGSATGNPANSIYVSNDNGVTNNYTINSTSVVQAYKDLIIPAGTTTLTFSYDWKSGGESSFDYFRVWLVPTTFTPTAGTQIAAGAGRIQIGGNLNLQQTWQTYFNPTLNVSTFAGQTMRLVYEWRNDGSGGTMPAIAIDNINVVIPTCQVPTNLSFNTLTPISANIAWTAASPAPANGYQYFLSTVNTPPTAATVPTGSTLTTSVPLAGLTPNTTYFFWVRSVCTGTDTSLWMVGPSFTTGQIPATIPYSQPFTGPNDWGFTNGTQANKWVYGSATGNPANSIYVSNDSGVTNNYTITSTSVVHAYRDIIVPAGSTLATFFYDWKSGGESSFDYFRVWMVPVSFTPTAGTQITALAGQRIQVGGNLNLQQTWQTYFNPTLNIAPFAGQTMRLVYEWRNDGSGGTMPAIAIDNINILIPTCQVPTNLTANPVGSTTATINWTAAAPVPANGYEYFVSTVNTPPTGATIPTGATAVTTANLTTLIPNTTYYFWVRSRCVGPDRSLWMAGTFTTGQIPATIPYIQPFTGPNDFGTTTGTQVNRWFYGAATGNTGNSLYISNDGGVTNTYTTTTTSVTHAYRDFTIAPGSTTVELSFDWKAVGEGSFDYLRVWAVPISFTPVAGTQITALAGQRVQIGTNFNQQATWQSYQNLTFNVAPYIASGMRLVFEWRNDGILGTQPPVAIDNVKLVRCDITAPVVTVSNVLSTSAVLTWNQDPAGATYRVRYRASGTLPWLGNFVVPASGLATNTYTLTTLTPLTTYEAEVAAVCNNVVGNYTRVTFETRCDPTPPGNFLVTNITAYTANLSWNPTLSATYTLQYREVGSPTWITVLLPGTNFQLTGLTPYTTYEVQVASICSGATNPYGTPKVFTTLPICEMAPIGLTVTNLTINSAQVDWNSFPNATYVLMYREVGFNNWVTVNLNTNTYVITGLLEQTQYEVKVANVCSGVIQVYTAPYVFTTPTVIYCDMSSISSTAEHISNVKVTPNGKPIMDNNSGASNYTSYTGDATKVIQLIQGSTNNTISVSKTWSSTTFDEAVTVWIDFNRDGIFSNNERILTSPANKTTPITANFNVPSNAFVSLVDNRFVVMRVAMSRGTAPVMCAQFQNGEVEDYKVRISKPNTQNLLDANSMVMVYPNPVKNILNITKVKDGTKYNIYNAIGQLVMKGTIFANKVDVSRLINGVFIIEVQSPDDNAQVKFIKE